MCLYLLSHLIGPPPYFQRQDLSLAWEKLTNLAALDGITGAGITSMLHPALLICVESGDQIRVPMLA